MLITLLVTGLVVAYLVVGVLVATVLLAFDFLDAKGDTSAGWVFTLAWPAMFALALLVLVVLLGTAACMLVGNVARSVKFSRGLNLGEFVAHLGSRLRSRAPTIFDSPWGRFEKRQRDIRRDREWGISR